MVILYVHYHCRTIISTTLTVLNAYTARLTSFHLRRRSWGNKRAGCFSGAGLFVRDEGGEKEGNRQESGP